ncbi:hypothetical protein BU23DRAFT_631876 [Bimuria novae-zelandiae CBS 107.79]|uniref:Rhodopsin domain-containing protein n=1 Tax=Bimuria novae-zelandiae CBS 107.79 TaxID=1447943 RepID=A0A6A5UHR5_9PLEO|nr:hypothetical protein BU23DRAFT_631876 [Bimuria novae-zelandiae CBS 107.79]
MPAILKMLEEHNIYLVFPKKAVLLHLNVLKLAKFDLSLLYGPFQTTALHSLEAFIGKIDFTKLCHHKVKGSMLGSPSSTAAYLMNVGDWDDEAELYLTKCVEHGGGFGLGGVPSAYPSEIFEFTWVLTTLIKSGFREELFHINPVFHAIDSLESQLKSNQGAVGFASGMLPDADDTAKSIYLLKLFNHPTSSRAIISQFTSPKGHIMTYLYERTFSISANCNALLCLLSSPEESDIALTVKNVTEALCNCWWENKMIDKWNLSQKYTLMLLTQAFVKLLRCWDAGFLKCLPDTLLKNRVMVVLTQILNQLLFDYDPSALEIESYSEEIAYIVLACAALQSLPWPSTILSQLDLVMQDGKLRLASAKVEGYQYLWIKKTTYSSETLAQAYYLAALHVSPTKVGWSPEVEGHFQEPKASSKMLGFFRSFFARYEPAWKFEASTFKSSTFTRMLQAYHADIFPTRDGYEDKYLPYIPVTWILINNFQRLDLATLLLWEMMKFSMWDFLIDEYMEASVASLPFQDRKYVKRWIKTSLFVYSRDRRTGEKRFHEDSSFINTLGNYAREVMLHPSVQAASEYDCKKLQGELRSFLLAHLKQINNSASLSSDITHTSSMGHTLFSASRSSFYYWVKSTASTHISCPISSVFYACLLSSVAKITPEGDCFATPRQKYKASDLCAPLAVISRLFNDYASIGRDQLEGNLNSVNFQEFHNGVQDPQTSNDSSTCESTSNTVRSSLLQLREYERQGSRAVLSALINEMRVPRHGSGVGGTDVTTDRGYGMNLAKSDLAIICKGMELFASATKLYADIYVARDLTNKIPIVAGPHLNQLVQANNFILQEPPTRSCGWNHDFGVPAVVLRLMALTLLGSTVNRTGLAYPGGHSHADPRSCKGINIAYLFANWLGAALVCQPFTYNWDQTIVGGHCGDRQRFYLWNSAQNLVQDIVLIIMPMPLLWNLHLPWLKKLSLTFIFAMGSGICVITLIRVIEVAKADLQDITHDYASVGILSVLEPLLGIVNCSLPLLRPVVPHLAELARFRRTSTDETKGSYTYGLSIGSRRTHSKMPDAYPLDTIVTTNGGFYTEAERSKLGDERHISAFIWACSKAIQCRRGEGDCDFQVVDRRDPRTAVRDIPEFLVSDSILPFSNRMKSGDRVFTALPLGKELHTVRYSEEHSRQTDSHS